MLRYDLHVLHCAVQNQPLEFLLNGTYYLPATVSSGAVTKLWFVSVSI